MKIVLKKGLLNPEEVMLLELIPEINDAFEKAIAEGKDPHVAVAAAIKCDRQHAKSINFARVYGHTGGKIHDSLDIDYSEAELKEAT